MADAVSTEPFLDFIERKTYDLVILTIGGKKVTYNCGSFYGLGISKALLLGLNPDLQIQCKQ